MYKMGRRQLYLERGGSGVDVQDGKPPVVVEEGWQRRTDLLLASRSVQKRLALNRMRVAQECLLQPDNGVFKFYSRTMTYNLCGRRKPSRGSRMAIRSGLSRFRCSTVMVVCILPGLSPTVTNGLPLIRCRTVTWSWLEGGLLFFPIDSLRLFLRS